MNYKREASRISQADQETNVYFESSNQNMQISTTEKYMMNRIRRLAEVEDSEWVIVHEDDLSMIAEAPKNLITLRAKRQKISEERRRESAERFRKMREADKGEED